MNVKSLLIFSSIIICSSFVQKIRVIQVDISPLLNARPVTTLTSGKLVSWTKGIDGNGDGDGYLTHSAAEFNGDKDAHSLPDNAIFMANALHPEIALHYNNNDSIHYQARYISGEGEFKIDIPKNHYSAIYLGLTSSEGPSSLQFELIYADGKDTKDYLLPDYYENVSEKHPGLSYVATDLAKWGKNDRMTEKDHHNIHLLRLNIDPQRNLKAIKVKKSKGGYLMFWSATGVIE
ncbi:MAG: hypothetical protein ACXVB0_18380 [Mucilaginibacter sp.]